MNILCTYSLLWRHLNKWVDLFCEMGNESFFWHHTVMCLGWVLRNHYWAKNLNGLYLPQFQFLRYCKFGHPSKAISLLWVNESLHTCTSRWSNWGGKFSPGENFSRIFRGEENFSPPLFSEFWCFPCGFWCQNSNWGGKYAQNSKWGEKKRGGDRPLTGGDKFSRIFLRGGKLTFPPLSLTLVHVWVPRMVIHALGIISSHI